MIRNYIFDLGGVIADLKTREAFLAFQSMGMPLPEGMFDKSNPINGAKSDVPLLNLIHRMDVGEICGEDFLKMVRSQCRPEITYEQILSAYNDLIEVPRHRLEMLRDLRKNHRVLLLSNIGDLHWEKFCELCADAGIPVEACFDKMYLSYQLKMAKPDKAIFEYVINDSGVIPEETLYIDDFIANIEAGKAAGLQTMHIQPNTLDECFSIS